MTRLDVSLINLSQCWKLYWENYISIFFLIEWDMIVLIVFHLILNQMEFNLVQKIERKTVTTIVSHSIWKKKFSQRVEFSRLAWGWFCMPRTSLLAVQIRWLSAIRAIAQNPTSDSRWISPNLIVFTLFRGIFKRDEIYEPVHKSDACWVSPNLIVFTLFRVIFKRNGIPFYDSMSRFMSLTHVKSVQICLYLPSSGWYEK